MPDISELRTETISEKRQLLMLKRQLRTFRNSMVPWQEDRSVHLRKWASRRFQILLVKFTLRTMIHKSKLMCREHGSTNRTQEFVLLTREKQESSKFNSTITQTLFLLEKASMQHLSSTTLQEPTEEFARTSQSRKTKSSPKSEAHVPPCDSVIPLLNMHLPTILK